MFLRSKTRKKDGKIHRYWSVVENRRTHDNRVVQRQVLYLGEINDVQRAAWTRAVEVFEDEGRGLKSVAIFADDCPAPELEHEIVQVRLGELQLQHPRQWGGCWLACRLWDQLKLDEFWAPLLPASRQGTRWLNVLKILVIYRLLDPGSEWRLHREWYGRSGPADLLGEERQAIPLQSLYRCLDKVLPHKKTLFSWLRGRWESLFGVQFEVLLYDLTSTYFESEPPQGGKRRYGYSRDKRFDCVQVVIALIITPQGFPLAYEVMPGNTADNTTLADFLRRIEAQYGKAERIWIMDRGIPTEETLSAMRQAEPPVQYLVGTPKGRLTKLEKHFLGKPWEEVRETLTVKLHEQDGELYVLARSTRRMDKERAIRRRRLKKLWCRLQELQQQTLTRDELLLKLGAAKKEAGRAYAPVTIELPKADEPITAQTFRFRLNRVKLRLVRRREGSYLLRSNLTGTDPAHLWQYYMQLTEIEQAFKELKGDLSIRPIYHQTDQRIEAHIFVAFIAYCLQVTLKHRLRTLAPGLTPRAALEKMTAIQMVDVLVPTTDGRVLVLPRYTQPDNDQKLLLSQLRLTLPKQPPPRIRAKAVTAA